MNWVIISHVYMITYGKKECQPWLNEETLGDIIAPKLTRNRQGAPCSK